MLMCMVPFVIIHINSITRTRQVYKCDVKTGKAEPYVYKPYRRDYAGPKGDGGI
jgi:hypothetical protein